MGDRRTYFAGGAPAGVGKETVFVAVDGGLAAPAVGGAAPPVLTDCVVAEGAAVLGGDEDGGEGEGGEEEFGDGEHLGLSSIDVGKEAA